MIVGAALGASLLPAWPGSSAVASAPELGLALGVGAALAARGLRTAGGWSSAGAPFRHMRDRWLPRLIFMGD